MVTAIQIDRLISNLPVEALGWADREIEAWAVDQASFYGEYGKDWYFDGDLLGSVDNWRRRVRRRLEDRIRKDPEALAAAAAAVRVSLA